MTGWRARVEDLLVAEATDALSSAEALELEALLREHPEMDRHSFELAAGFVFLAAAEYRSEGIPGDLYTRLLAKGEALVRSSD